MAKYVYNLTAKYTYPNEQFCITLKNAYNQIHIPIKLLDHTIFMCANDGEWLKIENEIFKFILKKWQKFLCSKIKEYKSHIEKIPVTNIDLSSAVHNI